MLCDGSTIDIRALISMVTGRSTEAIGAKCFFLFLFFFLFIVGLGRYTKQPTDSPATALAAD